MSTGLVFQEPGLVETRQERALRRAQQLHNAFQTAFEVLAEIYRDEDWKFINDAAGRPYTGFTAFVQDQMGCAASNARRYQQGIVGLILPLQELTAPGARIPVTSSDVARLGVTGSRVVVEEAPAVLEGVTDPDAQTGALRELIDSVAQRSTAPGFGPLYESTTPPAPASSLGALVPAQVPDDADGDIGDLGDIGDTAPRPPAADRGWAQPHDDGPPWEQEGPAHQQQPKADNTADPTPPAGPAPAASHDAQPGDTAQIMADLEAAIAAVMATGDPTALAEQLSSGDGAALAPKCLASGQRLMRLGQLLRSLN
ncbi:hypothetical protein [Mycolicibacterium frederiksbergense]|uniref:Uncharacterized protein n=1 Tax=Mycolicibacterium frederiksbergense TaxID=117567 RepID=A0A6H0RXI7_9MYCO|nr:hypothetical protein [Mycolicibacterium frederiksbergense]QIV79670.1 hypothetical protein EXE63_01120 [Mycolicibacterium frederiksbergense]